MKILEVKMQEHYSLGVPFVRTTVFIDGKWAWEFDNYMVNQPMDEYNPPGFGSANEKQAASQVFLTIQKMSTADYEEPPEPDVNTIVER